MQDWNLRKKILLGYGLVLLLLALVLGWAFFNLLRLGHASEAILSENYRSIRAADRMTEAVERQDSGVLLYLLGYQEEGLSQFRQNQNAFSESLGRAKDNITIAGEKEVLARIDSAYHAYLVEFGQLLQRDPPVEEAPSIYREEMLPAFLRVRRASTDLREMNQQTMFAASDRAEEVARRAEWSVGLIGLAALALGLVFSLMLSNRLVRPLRDMQAATARIAEGDYDVDVPARTSDELGRLGAQFNEMAAELRHFRDLNVGKVLAERRKSEAIIQSIDDGLVVVGADFTVQSMNPAAEEALGVQREEVREHHFLEVVRREGLSGSEQLFDYIQETVQSGRAPALDDADNFLRTEHDGETRHYQFLVAPVHAPNGQHASAEAGGMTGVILLLRNVTELKELDRLKSEFVATASHELKTPLTSIGMSIDLLEERVAGALDGRDRELLDAAQEDVGRLRALVDDLLDLSKIESGRLELERAAVPVALLFEKAMQNLQAQAEEHGVALSARLEEDALPDVKADANKITWVLNNLISNALRYTEAGGRVTLRAERRGRTVHCSVEDDGAGIPYAHQSKIFDKFVQIDSEQSVGGSGLGLAICREMVEAHGGRIWVNSTPGEGATFMFTLPVAGERRGTGEREKG